MKIKKHKPSLLIKPDNREFTPYTKICMDCPAGEMEGKGCIKDESRGC